MPERVERAALDQRLDRALVADDDVYLAQEVAEDAAYAPYLARQETELRELRASEMVLLGADFPYSAVPGLSREMIERLEAARPGNLSSASRVPGVTPAALAALLVHARRLLSQAA